ncbi:hypothetical protein [Micromonospora sp. NPDC049645]|uniref:hypothetical protein n=1 Tax=Micromonospora sp. NPDC049645 TaxID=3155508 RepID=UPI003416848C
MSGEVREGDDIELVNAAGELCLSEKGADQLKWLTVGSNFCEVDPDLMTLFNPTFSKILDYAGNVVGFAESDTQDLAQGVALEIWADVSGADLCDDPNAEQSFAYFLIPWVVGGTVGDWTIENAGLTTTVNSRTRRNSKWGVGPYDVMLNGPVLTPGPGPMLLPVGPREHRRVFVTTVPPPEVSEGAQPLSNPDGPEFTAIEGATPLTTSVTTAETGCSVNWGDGSAPAALTAATPLSHAYAAAGTYHVAVYKTATPALVTVETTEVPWP